MKIFRVLEAIPNRVTVMGQSSGAVDICLLMASPMATGLFQGAIMESGDCQSVSTKTFARRFHTTRSPAPVKASGDRSARDLGVAQGAAAIAKAPQYSRRRNSEGVEAGSAAFTLTPSSMDG